MKAILFDLDGTLLPMNQEVFVKRYLQELGVKGVELGYGAQELVKIVLQGFEIMVGNDGSMTNEERFWQLFIETYGGERQQHSRAFEEFYYNEFSRVIDSTTPTPLSAQAIRVLKQKGYKLVLATNPVFPRIATLERMRWAGLSADDFVLITTYENSTFAKPNLAYYQEILHKIELKPEQCLMVGNDLQEDLSVANLGMEVFLVTDDLINVAKDDYAHFPHGTREEMLDYLAALPSLN